MSSKDLSEREKLILRHLIERYVFSHVPVASADLSQNRRIGLSSASIRGTMHELEDRGFIHSPHTSAGRIPTDTGYRYYVDRLLETQELPAEMHRQVQESFTRMANSLGDIFQAAAQVLSTISDSLGVTLLPRFEEGLLERIELVRVGTGRLMAVFIFHGGVIRSIYLEGETDCSDRQIDEMRLVINERLVGLDLRHLQGELDDRLRDLMPFDYMTSLRERVGLAFAQLAGDALHVGTLSFLLRQPEFSERDKVLALLDLIDERTGLVEAVRRVAQEEQSQVLIGHESGDTRLEQCAVITRAYRTADGKGILSLIGPSRMPYSRLFALVDMVAQLMSDESSPESISTTRKGYK